MSRTDKDIESSEHLTIIGIGSSAGGLEAIRELVSTLPANIPASYVVVQHMSPHHKSLMTELVARQTSLEVADVVDKTAPKPNTIYITPPKADVIFEEGLLRLVDPSPEPASPKPSVDRFLSSLADSYGSNTMAIILSGTGSDGAHGVQAIREAGGITIAQDAESAKYDGMPQSAVQTGCVDLILTPMDIGTHLSKILSSPRDFAEFRKGSLEESPISDLLQILLARTRVDFRDYKQTTIARRIERRMVALGIEDREEYTKFCRNNPYAVDELFKDLLISVTRFFRDKEEFNQLENLLPQLIEDRGDGMLRIWVAGCATGEEAYSIAMLISEVLGGPKIDLASRVQIFATDIDKNALQVARKGHYGVSALNSIPVELADKYLVRENDGVRVVDSLRNAILFSYHNVCQDPPFQKIDLLCCRNLLIYFGNALQQRVMSRFHYSMTPHSLMFLGTAESVAGSDTIFFPHREASHVFQKRSLQSSPTKGYNMPNVPQSLSSARKSAPARTGPTVDRQLFDALIRSIGKNSVLVTESYGIARVYGDVSEYIEMKDSSNLKMHLDLLRSPLREEARNLVTISLKNGEHRSGVRHLLAANDADEVRLEVYPIIASDISERAALIVFTPLEVDRSAAVTEEMVGQIDDDVAQRIRALENDVAATREALQQTIEELETSNEELQSLNEELQSTNEELQATNEELETSNEELQSTNEELITVNEELQVTATELSGRTSELTSVLQSTPLAIVVLDSALQIQQTTKSGAALFNLQLPIGSPHVSQLSLPDGYPSLAPLCNEALKLGESVSVEFDSATDRCEMVCAPYFDSYGQVRGITLVVTKYPSQARELERILDTPNVFLMNRTRDGEILRISKASATLLGMPDNDPQSANFYDLNAPETREAMRARDAAFLDSGDSSRSDVIELKSAHSDKPVWMNIDRFKLPHKETGEPTVYAVGADISDVMKARTLAETRNAQLQLLQDNASIGYWSVDLDADEIYWSREVYRIHRLDPANYKPKFETATVFYHPDDIEEVTAAVQKVWEQGGEFEFVKRLALKNNELVHVQSHGVAVTDETGKVRQIVGIFKELPTPEA